MIEMKSRLKSLLVVDESEKAIFEMESFLPVIIRARCKSATTRLSSQESLAILVKIWPIFYELLPEIRQLFVC